MVNSFYVATGQPSTGAFAASAPMRSEFQDIENGFNLMPALTAGTAVVVNLAGTALGNTVGTLALAGPFATTGAFSTTLVAGGNVSITLPTVTGLTLATLTGTETFSNKTFGASNNMGTPTALVGTNITGTAAGLTAGTVTTNANLTGPITSSGNATTIASQTGTGSKFVVDTSPTLVTPILGVAAGTSLALGGATIGTNALAVTGTATISGNTGIGTTTPSTRLDVVGTGGGITGGARFNAAAQASTGGIYILGGTTGAGQYNFLIANQVNANQAFEITPSTVVGGTTFSTPVIQVAGAGGLILGNGSARVDITAGSVLRIGNAYVGTPASCTGTVTIQDSGGNTLRVLVASP